MLRTILGVVCGVPAYSRHYVDVFVPAPNSVTPANENTNLDLLMMVVAFVYEWWQW